MIKKRVAWVENSCLSFLIIFLKSHFKINISLFYHIFDILMLKLTKIINLLKINQYYKSNQTSYNLESNLRNLRNIIIDTKFPKTKEGFFWILNLEIKLSSFSTTSKSITPTCFWAKLNSNYFVVSNPKHNIYHIIVSI